MQTIRESRTARLTTHFRAAGVISLFLVCLLASFAAWSQEQIVVVANRDVSANEVSRVYLRSVFGMRTRTWPDNEPVRVFVLQDNHPSHEMFTKTILKTFPYNLRKIWDRRVFSGTGQYPTQVNSTREMYELVATVKNAIGYLPADEIGDDVKVLELKDR